MNIDKQFLLKRRITVVDYFLVLVVGSATVLSYLTNNWFAFGAGVLYLGCLVLSVRNGIVEMCASMKLSERNLYQIVDANNVNYYVLATSLEEAQLLLETDNINGDINYIGRVKYFE